MQRSVLTTRYIVIGLILLFIAVGGYKFLFYEPDLNSASLLADQAAARLKRVLGQTESYSNLVVGLDFGSSTIYVEITGNIVGDKETVMSLEEALSRECNLLHIPLRIIEEGSKEGEHPCFATIRALLGMDPVVVTMRTMQYDQWIEIMRGIPSELVIPAVIYGNIKSDEAVGHSPNESVAETEGKTEAGSGNNR